MYHSKNVTLICLLLLTAIAFAGLCPWDAVASFNQTRLLELALLAFLHGAYLLWPVLQAQTLALLRLRLKTSTTLALCTFWLLGLTAATRTLWPEFAFLDVGHYALLMIATLIVAALVRAQPELHRWILAGLAIGSAIAVTRFFIQVILTYIMGDTGPLEYWYTPYANPRFFAQAAVWTLPILALLPTLLTSKTRPKWLRCALTAISISTWGLLVWSGSRGALAGLVFGLICISFLSPKTTLSLRILLLRDAFLGTALWAALHSLVGWNIGGSLDRLTSSGRDLLIRRSWELIQAHPWLGIGPAQFPAYNFQPPSSFEAHPHNLLLQVATEWGVPAVLLLIFLLLRLINYLLSAVRQSSPQDSALNHALLLSVLATGALSMVDGPQIMPWSLICIVLCTGMLIGRLQPAESVIPSPSRNARLSLTFVLLLGWVMVAQGIAYRPGCAIYPAQADKVLPNGTGYDNPRFWVQGRIPVNSMCLEPGRYQGSMDMLYRRSLTLDHFP